jgi:phenylalanyl-tRNA synthetase alpha chain
VNPDIAQVRQKFQDRLAAARDAAALEQVRIDFLGRTQGRIQDLMTRLASLPKEEKPAFGKDVNELKREAQAAFDAAKAQLDAAGTAKVGPRIDVTMPGRRPRLGRLHPITQARNEMVEIFGQLGFTVAEGPEIEDEWHNFIALNIPPEHPARDPLDNYYIRDNLLLRTQTSTVQIRVMETQPPPVRMIMPGRVYRPDTVDAGHSNMFHQLEGLWVEEGVTFAHLKTVLAMFFHSFLGPQVKTRFRPHFFPFTEPSAEMDISCLLCGGEGCPACKRTGWVELLGCGMVDPNVLKAVGYDPEKVTGLAFGFGIDRLTMMKYGIPDIRHLFQNDLRFLRQF